MMSLDETRKFLEDRSEELNMAKSMDRNEMYKILIEYGNSMEEFPEELMTEDNFVKGCTSNVYIHSEENEGRIFYKGKSESMIVRGYLAILIKALSGLKQEDILRSNDIVQSFVDNTDIKASLTPSRANAFHNIYSKMREKAQ